MKIYKNLTFILIAFGISSCTKINQSIQRDVIITPEATSFITPIIADTLNQVVLGTILVSTDLDALIKSQDPNFSSANIESIKMTGFKLEFTDTNQTNNLANFQFLEAQLGASSQDTLSVASRNGIPESLASQIDLAVINAGSELKGHLTGSSINYTIVGLLRHRTSKSLNTRITPRYTVTLKM